MIELDRDDPKDLTMEANAAIRYPPRSKPMAAAILSPSFFGRFLRSEANPRWAFLFITRSCNINCAYCNVPKQSRDEMSVSEWTKVLDRLQAWRLAGVNILGGEPLLRKDLVYDLVERATARRLLTTLTTNGILLNQQTIDKFAELGLFSLQISVDSLQRGPKYHPEAIDLLEYAKDRGIIPVICTVATARNVRELPSMARTLASHDIMFSCGLYQSIGRNFSVRRPELIPSHDDTSKSFSALLDIKRRHRRIRNSDFSLRHYQNLDLQSSWHCNSQHDAWVCVDCDGSLMVCQENPTELKLLDIETLSSPKWRETKAKQAASCSGCSYLGYIDEQEVRGISVFRELPVILSTWWTYGRRR